MAGGILKGKTIEGGSYPLIHGVHLPLHNTYLYARRLEHKHMHTDIYSVGPKRRNEIPIIFWKKSQKGRAFLYGFLSSQEEKWVSILAWG